MSDTSPQRRLAAILAADVAGYTRLVEQDTEATVAAWKAARDEAIKPLVGAKSGRIIKFTGDGFLAEFSSVQDAVACAISLQEKLASCPLKFRIGVDVGDITDDGGDVHGEGVNIAARLEALADPGGICISGDVHNQVRHRINATFKDLGERQLKHVSQPVRIWKIVSDAEPESVIAEDAEQEIRYCTSSDGTALAYAITGHGQPLLKSAHFMTHLEHDWHSPTFGPFFREMTVKHSFIRFDQRGNGLSDRNPEDISYELFVQDIESVADAAGLQRFAIYGLSQGAAVAISYAVRHPERVSALILHGGYARGRLKRDNLTDDDRLKVESLTNLIRTGWGQDNPAFRQMFTTMFIPGASSELMDSFNEMMSVATEPGVAAKIFEVNSRIDVSDILHQVQAPTLIVHGRGDAVSPFEEGRRMAASIPGARLIELDTANHLPLHDEPVYPRIIAEINKFLAEHPV